MASLRPQITLAYAGRIVLLLAGLYCFALGIVLNVQANAGQAPWNAFHFGLHLRLGITIGEASLGAGLAMLLVSWLLGIRPGVGTLANMTLVGFFTDRIFDLGIVREQHEPVGQLLMLAAGLAVLAFGTALYMRPRLGAGPRDSFMLALARRLGVKPGIVRSGIEAFALAGGWALGSPIGVGTVVYVFGIGPAIQLALRLLPVSPTARPEPATAERLEAAR